MKKTLAIVLTLVLWVVTFTACDNYKPSSNDTERERQEVLVKEAGAKVGMPALHNFREKKFMAMIMELCDKEVVTYAYLDNMIPTVVHGHTALGGKLTYYGETIGYGLPYSTQFTAPESMQRYYVKSNTEGKMGDWGIARLPQSDPNGLFKPASANGTWVLIRDPNTGKIVVDYVEPNIIVKAYKLPFD